jgi:hypothetical protein
MVEISLSGSGEGLGWETGRGYSTAGLSLHHQFRVFCREQSLSVDPNGFLQPANPANPDPFVDPFVRPLRQKGGLSFL